MEAWQQYLTEWQDLAASAFHDGLDGAWTWFDSLSREEWLVVLAACCAGGFLFLKSWGHKGPC